MIYRQSGDDSCQWLYTPDTPQEKRIIKDAKEGLSYQMPEIPFEITQKDFKKVVLDYMLFENGIDKKDFEKTMLESLLYDSHINLQDSKIEIILGQNDEK